MPEALPEDASVGRWRSEVPGLRRQVHGRALVYMDYASTAQRPQAVLEAVERASIDLNANVARGVHRVAAEASEAHATARAKVAAFVGATPQTLVFTTGTTDGLNLAAHGIAASLQPGDRILVSLLDHHANLIPWQMAAARTGAQLEPIPLRADRHLDVSALENQLEAGRVRVVALPLLSNVLGIATPVQAIAARAHAVGAIVVLDAAQAVAHGPLDVAKLGVDVLAFSGHKLFGPLGIGALWAREDLLAQWPPWRTGGGIVREVRMESTTFRDPPARFEPGSPNLPAALGLAAAIDWLTEIGWAAIQARERALVELGGRRLDAIQGLSRLSTDPSVPIFSFALGSIHAHDVASMLDLEGIATRAGRHCTDPLHAHLGLVASTRASLSFLNTSDEVMALANALERAAEMFS